MKEFDKLDELIENEIERIRNLDNLDDGEEKSEAIKNLANLMKIKSEEKIAKDSLEDKKREKRTQIIDWIVKIAVVGLQVGIPAYTFSRYVKAGFEFEKEGTYTFSTFKNVLSKYKPF